MHVGITNGRKACEAGGGGGGRRTKCGGIIDENKIKRERQRDKM